MAEAAIRYYCKPYEKELLDVRLRLKNAFSDNRSVVLVQSSLRIKGRHCCGMVRLNGAYE